MKVLYYTAAPLLDIAIEKINILKHDVDLHVLIEVTQNNAHRVEINKLPSDKIIVSISELINDENFKFLKPYFDGCISSNFLVHTSKTGFSFSTLIAFIKTWIFIRKMNPDIIHVEAITIRSFGLLPFLFSRKRFFFTIHDPVPHSGDANWKVSLPVFLFLRTPYSRGYFFYSKFAKDQFEQNHKKDKHPKYLLKMYPYSYYKKYINESSSIRKHILFFGSLSYYKGIDILLDAMPLLFEKLPNEILVIAGRRNDNYNFSIDKLEQFKDRILVLDNFISNKDLVKLIREAKLVVCPYLDATQSGVLMTSYAIDTPVIASDVGAFPEYIDPNITGILVPVSDPVKLSEALILALSNNLWEDMSSNIKTKYIENPWINNRDLFLSVYFQRTNSN